MKWQPGGRPAAATVQKRDCLKMTRSGYIVALLIAGVLGLASWKAQADDQYVRTAKSLSVWHFDKTLPDQPVEKWMRVNLPTGYEAVWGPYITDCGESTGSPVDRERDMPLCAEIELRKGGEVKGYLALFVGTQKRGLVQEGAGLYFGYLEHRGKKYEFRRLSDLLHVE
jgi:hypothetical protein